MLIASWPQFMVSWPYAVLWLLQGEICRQPSGVLHITAASIWVLWSNFLFLIFKLFFDYKKLEEFWLEGTYNNRQVPWPDLFKDEFKRFFKGVVQMILKHWQVWGIDHRTWSADHSELFRWRIRGFRMCFLCSNFTWPTSHFIGPGQSPKFTLEFVNGHQICVYLLPECYTRTLRKTLSRNVGSEKPCYWKLFLVNPVSEYRSKPEKPLE